MMAEIQIEWTDSTWKPVAGCSIITAGCTHCYAMEMAKRLEAMGIEKHASLTRKTGNRTVWNGAPRVARHERAMTIFARAGSPIRAAVIEMSGPSFIV
jgi:protein gp37